LIKKHDLIGTEVWTDMWKGYSSLQKEGYIHKTVNHSTEFKSADGICTNSVEGLWSTLKRFLRHVNVLWSKLLPEHTGEFMWRKTIQGCPREQFTAFLDYLRNAPIDRLLPLLIWFTFVEFVVIYIRNFLGIPKTFFLIVFK